MRDLFTPARGLLLALLLPLAACDSNETPGALVGRWTLDAVSDAITDDPVVGPLGSVLVLEADGTLQIESGNDCSGTYDAEFIINSEVLTLAYDGCTEVATTPETDLSLLLPGTGRNSLGYIISPGALPRLVLNGIESEGRVLELGFTAHSR